MEFENGAHKTSHWCEIRDRWQVVECPGMAWFLGFPHCRGLWASSDLDTTGVCLHRMGFVSLPVPEGANPRQSGLWDGRADAQSKIRLLTEASRRLRSGSAPRSCQCIAEETWSPCTLVRLSSNSVSQQSQKSADSLWCFPGLDLWTQSPFLRGAASGLKGGSGGRGPL